MHEFNKHIFKFPKNLNMDLICRTCLAYEDELEPLFSKKLVDSEYKEITTMILLCTGLEIPENDELSNTICSQCIESIIAAFKYRKMVWASNSVLLETTKVLFAEAGTNLNIFKMNTRTEPKEFFDDETLGSDIFIKVEEPNDTEFRSNDDDSIIEIEEVTSDTCKTNQNMKKIVKNIDKFSSNQPYNKIESDLSMSDFSEQSYIKLEPIDKSPTDEHALATVINGKCFKTKQNEKNVLHDEAETKLDFLKINTKTEPKVQFFDEETLGSDILEIVEEPNYTELVSSENETIIDIEGVTSKTRNKKKNLRNADKSTIIHIYETIEPGSPLSDHFNIEDMQNYMEFDPNDTSDIDKLDAITTNNNDSFKRMDKFIKINKKSTKTRRYSCTLCSQTYEVLGPLRRHLVIHHNFRVAQAFQCNKCLKTFFNKKNFKRHLNQAHIPENLKPKTNVCNLCGKGFKFKSSMIEHINRHKGIKKFKCKTCEFSAVSLSILKIHLRSHTDERPYVCHLCGNAFKTSGHRNHHIKEVHAYD